MFFSSVMVGRLEMQLTFWRHPRSRPVALGLNNLELNCFLIAFSRQPLSSRETFASGFRWFPLVGIFVFCLGRQRRFLWFPSALSLATSANHCVADSGRAEGNNTDALSMSHFKLSPCLIKPGKAHSWMKVNSRMWGRWKDMRKILCRELVILSSSLSLYLPLFSLHCLCLWLNVLPWGSFPSSFLLDFSFSGVTFRLSVSYYFFLLLWHLETMWLKTVPHLNVRGHEILPAHPILDIFEPFLLWNTGYFISKPLKWMN